MQFGQHPDAIDTRLVFRIYAWVAIPAGAFVYAWPKLLPDWIPQTLQLAEIPSYALFALTRVVAAAVVFAGCGAAALASADDPVGRRRGLYRFAIAHVAFGVMFWIQWTAIFDNVFPPVVAWTPLVAGVVLLYVAATCARVPRLNRPFTGLLNADVEGPVFVDRARPGLAMDALRSQYEQQIRQAARLEERARLARDLHDAVKQQLFAIQTSAATAQARITSDIGGAHSALEQVRMSARDAMTEMEAMIEQLQAAPMENTGLVAALRHQCEALGLRTGAEVIVEVESLPPSDALPPGAQQALFRAAQEALANVARHARAKHVVVRLGLAGSTLRLIVRDDGVGFNPSEASPGMGTESMMARASEAGGTLVRQSQPGRGTTVVFSVPCDTSGPRDFARKALVWTLVAALMTLSLTFGDAWERPWNVLVLAIAAITIARYVAAWYRVRHRTEPA